MQHIKLDVGIPLKVVQTPKIAVQYNWPGRFSVISSYFNAHDEEIANAFF